MRINEVDLLEAMDMLIDDEMHYFGGRYEEETETFKTKISLESEESANAAA